ncbi:MAG: HAMP domain-containing sensor histidine kinase [Candidatus Korobacteraceae bacterium]
MSRLRLRTKFLIAMLLTSAGLTAVSLLIVQRTVANQVRHGLSNDLADSVETFRNVQREREAALTRSAELMADLPNLKALMTSHHAPTIQDASQEMLHLSGGDLFALLDPTNQIVGFHTKSPGITRAQAQELLSRQGSLDEPLQWWFAGGHLYQVVLTPIYFGPRADNALLGVVALGSEMNAAVARQVSQVAASQVAIVCDRSVVVSTLKSEQAQELASHLTRDSGSAGSADWKLGKESFVVSSLTLNPDESPRVTIFVLKSYDEATAFLNRLRHLLLAVGLGAVFGGSLFVYIIASTFTRPLEKLVDGVRALGGGDFRYPVHTPGASEVAELTDAFSRMRESLHEAQQRLLNAERLATIGRMASSISHDLRHPLTAVLANAEFLADADLNPLQREELYLEIRVAVNRLTDLIDSLLELSRPAESLSVMDTPVERTISRAIELVRAHRQFHKITVGIDSAGLHSAQFDPRKMERVFYNLLLNSCQAVQTIGGHVSVTVTDGNGELDIRIVDDGPGIESSIRDKLFQPFVSHGKENGTGLGLTIAQKIVQDHSGSLHLESSMPGRTVMQIILPRVCQKAAVEHGRAADTSQSFTT